MADIPVERREKSAFPWWLIPLLLLLLLLPLLYFTCGRNNVVVDNTNANRAVGAANNGNYSGTTTGTNNSTVAPGAGNTAVVVNNNASGAVNPVASGNNAGANSSAGGTAAVTAVNYFGTVTDKTTIVGRGVDLRSARVSRVLSDRVFTVKSENEEMFVMLDENLDSAGGKEEQVKIRPGQNLKLAGSFRAVPTGEVTDERQGGGLNGKEYARMTNQKVYLHATGVEGVR